MLELRPTCEHCEKALPPNAEDAMICSYECTFCCNCVNDLLDNVCPNCGGGFSPRPIRPKFGLQKFPASPKKISRQIPIEQWKAFHERYGKIQPKDR
jgi:hypothetical protein